MRSIKRSVEVSNDGGKRESHVVSLGIARCQICEKSYEISNKHDHVDVCAQCLCMIEANKAYNINH
jgi:hypothetical protein